jgi:hypothetical protein
MRFIQIWWQNQHSSIHSVTGKGQTCAYSRRLNVWVCINTCQHAGMDSDLADQSLHACHLLFNSLQAKKAFLHF